MNAKSRYTHIVALAAVALFVAAGCSSTGVDRAEQKVASMERVRASVVEAKTQVGTTTGALQEVVGSANTDPRPAFAKYTAELAKLDASAATVRAEADDMRAKSQDYFDNWSAQLQNIQNPDIKARAELARQEFTAQFAKIKDAGQVVKMKFEPLSAELHDIHKYLDLNLNAAGIASIKDLVAKAGNSTNELNTAVDNWLQALDAARTALAPFKAPEAGAPKPEEGAPQK